MARFSPEDRQTIWDMREAGVPVKRIAKHLGRQNSSLRKFIADAGGTRPTARERSELRLSLEEREEISRGLAAGLFDPGHCRGPGPLSLDGVPGGQRQRRPQEVSGPRCRPGGLPAGAATRSGPSSPSAAGSEGWSSASSRPSGHPSRSRRGWLWMYPDHPEMQVSHETIYQSLFVQSRGALRKELHSCLRTGRAMRRAKAYTKGNVGQGQLTQHGDDLRAPGRGGGPGGAGPLGR